MQTEEMLAGDLQLDIGGEHFDLHLEIPATPVKPQRMLPVFQTLTNTIVARGIERSEAAGNAISCKSGCGACCRQPLLISEAEAYNLAEMVKAMPEPRREIVKKRFADGRQHFENRNWFERFNEFSRQAEDGDSEALGKFFVALLSEYIEQRVACPFLENESCSIYESRPLICREYLVTSPPENCKNPTPYNTQKLPISGTASRAMGVLCKTPNSKDPASLLLIRLLEFAESNSEQFEKRIGPAWADDFFRLLTRKKDPGLPAKSPAAEPINPSSVSQRFAG